MDLVISQEHITRAIREQAMSLYSLDTVCPTAQAMRDLGYTEVSVGYFLIRAIDPNGFVVVFEMSMTLKRQLWNFVDSVFHAGTYHIERIEL